MVLFWDGLCYNFIDKFVFVAYNNIAKEFAKQLRFAMCGKETLSKGFGFCQSPWLLGEHIKYNAGIRIVYKLIRTKTEMLIIVVGARADNDVYEAAQHRADKHNL